MILNNVFNDKTEVSLLRNKDHLNNIIHSQKFPVIKQNNKKNINNFRQRANIMEIDCVPEKVKILKFFY